MQLSTIPDAPEHLQDIAKAKWRELCGLKLQSERGLRLPDLALIEFAAIAYDKAREALREMDSAGLVEMNPDTSKLAANPAAGLFSRFHADYVKRLIDLELARTKPPITNPTAQDETDDEGDETPAPVQLPDTDDPTELLKRLKVVG